MDLMGQRTEKKSVELKLCAFQMWIVWQGDVQLRRAQVISGPLMLRSLPLMLSGRGSSEKTRGIRAMGRMCVCVCVCVHNSVMFGSLQPPCTIARLLCPWNSPGKNTGVGCHSLSDPGFTPRSLALQEDSWLSEAPGKNGLFK